MRVALPIVLSEGERGRLLTWSRGRSVPHRLVLRSRAVLLASEGLENKEIAERLHVSEPFVGKWRSRFHRLRIAGIARDAPRPGRKPEVPPQVVRRILHKTLYEKPLGATHWSTRTLAEAIGVSHMTIARVWRAHRLKPHLAQSFKLSRDREFTDKLVDVVGLYVNPPQHAAVFGVDEKTQIQALERKQAVLPMGPGFPEGRSWDYRRNGTIDLFAALNVLDGTVITQFHHRHRHQEFLQFLRAIDEAVPPELDVHLVLDNLSVHKHERVRRWLARRPRFRFHFVPTSSSWLNAVEQWLSQLTSKRIRRGSFRSVRELVRAIREYVEAYSENPRPFVWTKSANEILRKLGIINQALVTAH